jgi:tRNA pseudouridine38-40 synthase
LGEHDFSSFCRYPGEGKPTVRDLQRVSVAREGSVMSVRFRANAFLHQMVRTIVGTLVRVGEGKLEPQDVRTMLEARRRSVLSQPAPPWGLTLERVSYGPRRD